MAVTLSQTDPTTEVEVFPSKSNGHPGSGYGPITQLCSHNTQYFKMYGKFSP
jgi:hypothetical protein